MVLYMYMYVEYLTYLTWVASPRREKGFVKKNTMFTLPVIFYNFIFVDPTYLLKCVELRVTYDSEYANK